MIVFPFPSFVCFASCFFGFVFNQNAINFHPDEVGNCIL